MSFTEKWNLEKPIEGALDWNISLNSNFDIIDSALQDIRTNFSASSQSTGPGTHADIGTLWYSTIQNPGIGLFVRHSTGYSQIIDKPSGDLRYLKKTGDTFNGDLKFAQNGIIKFSNDTTGDFSEIFLQTYNNRQSLEIRFGTSSDSAVRFIGNNGTDNDVLHLYTNKIKAFVPVEVPNATLDVHSINKGQADATYATMAALDSAISRIEALEQKLNAT